MDDSQHPTDLDFVPRNGVLKESQPKSFERKSSLFDGQVLFDSDRLGFALADGRIEILELIQLSKYGRPRCLDRGMTALGTLQSNERQSQYISQMHPSGSGQVRSHLSPLAGRGPAESFADFAAAGVLHFELLAMVMYGR